MIQIWFNVERFDDPLNFGYSDVPFTPDWRAVPGLLADPEKSVFLFAPITLLLVPATAHLWRRNRDATLLLGANLGATFAIAAAWPSWEGGWAWGPRLLLPGLLPALAVVAPWLGADRRRRQATWALFAVGLAVSAATLVVPTKAQQLDRPIPDDGPRIVRQFELVPKTISYTRRHAFDHDTSELGEHRRYVNVWQVGALRELGRKGMVPAVIGSVLLAALAAGAGWRARGAARAPMD
jgi:hypothetical protein